jgi:NCS1 family nucleobase:cation symporter-1
VPIFDLNLEMNSINFVEERERGGKPSSLFWPWCGANVSLLALSYGAFFLGFGISFPQVAIATLLSVVLSFVLVGISSLAGKRSNAPTMTLSRAAFGVRGNIVPGLLSYLIFVGWETVLVGHMDHNLARVIGFLLAVGLTVFGGVLGFHVIMKLQKWLTIATATMTIGYIVLTVSHVDWSKVTSIHGGNLQAFIGAIIFGITGVGLGWVNSAADYSRYLPRNTSSRGVIGWTVFGSSLVPVILIIFGAMLAGSSKNLSEKIMGDPVGALTTLRHSCCPRFDRGSNS